MIFKKTGWGQKFSHKLLKSKVLGDDMQTVKSQGFEERLLSSGSKLHSETAIFKWKRHDHICRLGKCEQEGLEMQKARSKWRQGLEVGML